MLIAKVTRKLLLNWYALTFTAIFTLGLTGAVGLSTSRRTSFRPAVRFTRHDVGDFLHRVAGVVCRVTEFYRGKPVHHASEGEAK
jgi:hypothetical protein